MQLRRIVFTWNNWQKDFDSKESLESYFQSLRHIKYYCIGFEVGEQGTHHLQGFIQFSSAKTFNTLRDYLKNNHIEQVKGTFQQATDYCKKGKDYIEYGDAPIEQGIRTDINDFIQAIKQGYTDSELLEMYPSQYLKYNNMLEKIRELTVNNKYATEPRLDLEVTYIYGTAGTGKSRYILEYHGYENVFRISDYKNPFDGYNGENVIVFEEFHSQLPITLMLNALDIYPFRLPCRYNDKLAVYTQVYIVSNKNLYQQYENIQRESPKTFKAFERRIHDIINFDTESERLPKKDISFNDLTKEYFDKDKIIYEN